MEGLIGSIPSRNHEPTLSSHHPTRSVAVRKQQGPGHAGRRQQQQQEDDQRNQHQERRPRFFLREKETDLDKGAQETSRGKRRRTGEKELGEARSRCCFIEEAK
jgi:hypothetical protein